MSDPLIYALAAGTAFAAGALNAIGGGGTFLTFPALVMAGVGPISANATSAWVLWPASVASALGYRRELSTHSRLLRQLAGVSFLGGALGAALLVATPPVFFVKLVPFLLAVAALTFTFGDSLRRRILGTKPVPTQVIVFTQALISLYGGYFGAGMGLLMLASFTLLGLTDLHALNGLKSVLAALVNAVAIVAFVFTGLIDWPFGAVMAVGAIAGGFLGARLALKVNERAVRWVVIALSWLMTVWFFVRTEKLP